MCGLAGVVGFEGPPPSREAVGAMVSALRHRGPDEFGLYRDRHAALGHARLSIIDLAQGQQPMANEDRTLWVVFNGEVYNHIELRQALEARGHVFRTRSDTEVLLHAWEEWGEDAFGRFNGQFALALWDTRRRELVLARDPFGVRPLYLCAHGGRLWFASEVKALFAALPDLPRALDPAGLAETFTFWTVVPPRSVFQGLTELEPGHLRRVTADGVRDVAFWQPRFPTSPAEVFPGSLDDAVAEVRQALEEAVRLRLVRADVPVGSYLSGGLDSSLVAALGRRVQPGRFCTFSVRFESAEHDETDFQREVATRLGTEHREVVVRAPDIARVFPDVVAHAERPLLRTAPAPLFLLSGLVREAGLKVVLTGEGADEVFGGYDLFREGKVRRFWGRQPGSTLRPRLLERLYPYLARSPTAQQALAREFFGQGREAWATPGFAHQPRWRTTAGVQRLLAHGVREAARGANVVERLLRSLPADFPRWSFLAQDQYLEVRTLLSGYLLSSQGDRMAMAHSVEGRFPFLDPHVVALANALPPSHKLKVLDEKHVLKRAGEGLVPPRILARSKQPYRAPNAACFVGPEAPGWVEQVLAPEAVRAAGVFDPDGVARLWRKARAQDAAVPFSNADDMALVGVLSTQLLHQRFVATPPRAEPPPSWRTDVDFERPGGTP